MQRLTWGVLAAAVALNACQGVTEPQNAGTGMARLPFTAVTPTITMTDLGTLGGSYSEPYGVNALGQVVGVAQTPGKYPHAFLWDDGVMTDLGTLGGSLSYALAVNERGQVVGYSDYNPLSNNTHAFLWQDGAMTDLGPFGHCCYAAASAINNRGQAVGSGPVGGGRDHAFLWQDGAMIDLGTLGGRLSVPGGVNGRGQVVGTSGVDLLTFHSHAFLWQDGAMTDLGTLGGSESEAR